MKRRFILILHNLSDFYKHNKRVINFIIQLAISILLIILLLNLINIPDMLLLLKNINVYYFILLLILITIDRIFMAYKWLLLLRVKYKNISFFTVIKIYYVGTFVGFFLPTTVGGDLVRVLKLQKEKHKGSDALSSVILERILGFIASAILASITTILLIFLFKLNIWHFLIIAAVVLFVLALILIISFNKTLVSKIEKSEKLSGNFLVNNLKKFYLSYAEYKDNKGLIALFLILSIIEQLIPVIANYLAALALSLKIPLIYFTLITPTVQLISKVPISFEGIGVTEGLMVYFFTLLGLAKTDAFSIGILGHIAVIIATLPALVFYFRDIKASLMQDKNEVKR